jgi:hypothetical protein
MPIIKFENKEYEFDNLSDEAKAQFMSLKFVEDELVRIQSQYAAMQTAKMAYSKALAAALPV